MRPQSGRYQTKPRRGRYQTKPQVAHENTTPPQRGRLGAIIATTLVVVAVLFSQPRVTPLWSLYVGDRAAANGEVLFLEPFPNSDSCSSAARALGTTGQWTSCRARLSLSLRHSVRLVTLQQEFVPGGAWERLEALCGLDAAGAAPRPGRVQKRSRSGSTDFVKSALTEACRPPPFSSSKKPFGA